MSNMPAARVPIAQAATKNVANRKTFWSHARYVLSDNPFTLVAVVLFAAFVLIAIAGRWIAPHDPLASNATARGKAKFVLVTDGQTLAEAGESLFVPVAGLRCAVARRRSIPALGTL